MRVALRTVLRRRLHRTLLHPNMLLRLCHWGIVVFTLCILLSLFLSQVTPFDKLELVILVNIYLNVKWALDGTLKWIRHLARAQRMSACGNQLQAAWWAIRNGDRAIVLGYVLLLIATTAWIDQLIAGNPFGMLLGTMNYYLGGVLVSLGHLGLARRLPSRTVSTRPGLIDALLVLLFVMAVIGAIYVPEYPLLMTCLIGWAAFVLFALSTAAHWYDNRNLRRLRLRHSLESERKLRNHA